MENKIFVIDGKELNVILPDFEVIKNDVSEYRDNYYEESYDEEIGHNSMLYKLYTDEHATFEEVEKDVEEMIDFVSKIENNLDLLEEYVNLVKKKKNGLFWLKSGYTIKELSSCTEYFTDFTNAWSTPELRLDVISEDECVLRFRYRTITH